jgi:cardiolipin synthase
VTPIFAINWSYEEHRLAYQLTLLAHLALQIVLSVRVIMRRRGVGESLAWILVIWVFWIVGPIAYMIFGELRLGKRRIRRFLELFPPIRKWLEEIAQRTPVQWADLGVECEPLSRVAEQTIGLPTQPGNHLELLDDWEHAFQRLIADIDQAQDTCHLVFYIWYLGGAADEVAEALIRASRRGVVCRVLVDALGSHKFLRSKMAARLREAGIHLRAALPGSIFRILFVRFDLRMHRKIVVIDGQTAYTGSLNLVDPRFFKRDSGVGQWVDAMVRVQGPAVESLAVTFLADWYVETEASLEELRQTVSVTEQPHRGECAVQVLPSGPTYETEAIEDVLLMAVYAAREELVLTTPYFVPSESLRIALASAARRGVKVVLIVPARVDSLLVRYASQAFKGELLRAGVRIANFDGGLLHTKSVTIDGEISLFGSLNLDPRSMRLNFEISLAIYNRDFAARLRALQQTYIDNSQLMDLETWDARPNRQRFAENCARLLGPLL